VPLGKAVRTPTRPLEVLPGLEPLDDLFDPSLGMLCARCRHRTGNFTQGHYWSWCAVTRRSGEDFHFCCPGDCERQQS
jgi:hypothetical protein